MRSKILVLRIVLAFVSVSVSAQDWQLVWSDEFNGPAGSTPDSAKWGYELGNNHGWGNHELENYTNLPKNAHLDGQGHLVIHVESVGGQYTSARLRTLGKFSVQYGRIEARIKVPFGQGIWPAFWMLGHDIGIVGWPQCGEIDIMEHIGKEPPTNHASLHGPGYSGGNPVGSVYVLPNGERFSENFHTFAVRWSSAEIVFSIDGVAYFTANPSSVPAGRQWVFDHPFFLLLNVAVGGAFPGPPDSTTRLPQEMLVDYVRVYQIASTEGPVIHAGAR
jgi:beta-glucanase (GH16 family)